MTASIQGKLMVVLTHRLLDVGIARIHNLGELFSRPIVQRDNNKIFLGDRQGAISPSLYVEQADLIRQRWVCDEKESASLTASAMILESTRFISR